MSGAGTRLAIEFDLHPPTPVANIVLDAASVLDRESSAAHGNSPANE